MIFLKVSIVSIQIGAAAPVYESATTNQYQASFAQTSDTVVLPVAESAEC
jgi:ethanolamine ammonia-lyase small subunit